MCWAPPVSMLFDVVYVCVMLPINLPGCLLLAMPAEDSHWTKTHLATTYIATTHTTVELSTGGQTIVRLRSL